MDTLFLKLAFSVSLLLWGDLFVLQSLLHFHQFAFSACIDKKGRESCLFVSLFVKFVCHLSHLKVSLERLTMLKSIKQYNKYVYNESNALW